MKKTLLITLDFPPQVGGVANYYFNLCKNLEKDKIVVLTSNNKPQDFPFKVYNKNLLFKFLPKYKWLPMIFVIKKIAKAENIEYLWAGEVLPTGTAVMFVSKLLKLPYVISCHGNDILQAQKFANKKKLALKILTNARAIIVNSKYTKKLIIDLEVNPEKVKVIYPGVAKLPELDDRLVKNLKTKYNLDNKKILLSIGRLVQRKGFDKVIESLPEDQDLIYIIAGAGPDEARLKKLAGDNSGIIFLDKITDEEKSALLSLCDIFIAPARQTKDDVEGFGIVYLEAGQFGKPVIAGNVGGVPEAVIDNKTGLLVDPENTTEIANAITKLLSDKGLREGLGQAGKARLKEFQWPDKAQILANILK